ncbi:uncharacterized protein PRCAT00006280001 [Priceomyces carsonii]|uniref:uncharacterized protein n=1 Tax=Priceomyces carsonii TaxID=28549 RepID=UPI002ED8F51C|nr:unnamed protein product [Priceomyces carsonii]
MAAFRAHDLENSERNKQSTQGTSKRNSPKQNATAQQSTQAPMSSLRTSHVNNDSLSQVSQKGFIPRQNASANTDQASNTLHSNYKPLLPRHIRASLKRSLADLLNDDEPPFAKRLDNKQRE